MKNLILYSYLIIGFMAGFMLAINPGGHGSFPVEKIGYFIFIIVVAGFYKWMEDTGHERHIAKWESYRRRGRTHFVTLYYVLGRAILVFLLFFFPILTSHKVTPGVKAVLSFTAVFAVVSFGFLGLREWSLCSADFSAKAMAASAERLKGSGLEGIGGGS